MSKKLRYLEKKIISLKKSCISTDSEPVILVIFETATLLTKLFECRTAQRLWPENGGLLLPRLCLLAEEQALRRKPECTVGPEFYDGNLARIRLGDGLQMY